MTVQPPAHDAGNVVAATATATQSFGRAPRRWALWSQPWPRVGYFLITEVLAVGLVAARADAPVDGAAMRRFVFLLLLGVLASELARRTERVRRSITDTPHINMTSVWTFAGVLLLPYPLLAALVVGLYLHLAVRSWQRLRRAPIYRVVCNSALAILTCYAAKALFDLHGSTGLLAPGDATTTSGYVLLALVADFVVGAVILLPGLGIDHRDLASMFGSWSDNALELSTLCLGLIAAVLLVGLPPLVVLVVPPLVLLQRSMLVKQLEHAASTDAKTGALNADSWRSVADREVARSQRSGAPLGIMMLDLDHFKRINDSHGHLVGDDVLKRVADTIAAEVREYDTVGRFGGEEFVVVLPATSRPDAVRVCERIRQAVGELRITATRHDSDPLITGLTVSIGFAMRPSSGSSVDELLAAADAALYCAKREGRDRVVCADDAIDRESTGGRSDGTDRAAGAVGAVGAAGSIGTLVADDIDDADGAVPAEQLVPQPATEGAP